MTVKNDITSKMYKVNIYSSSGNDIKQILKKLILEKSQTLTANQSTGGIDNFDDAKK